MFKEVKMIIWKNSKVRNVGVGGNGAGNAKIKHLAWI